MTPGFRLQQPQVFGSRTIVPVVSGNAISHGQGMFASLRPVALLIGEGGGWGIALLEGDSVEAILEKIELPV